MNLTPTLEGHGVRLEPISLAHLPQLEQIAIEPTIWRYMTLRIETPADVRAWVEDTLCLAETGTVMPWVTMIGNNVVGSSRFLDYSPQHRTAEIGFTWITQAMRGKGLNPRVKLLQFTYGFEQLHLRRIALKTHHENLHSQNAMLKLGAKFEGTFRNHMIIPDGSTRHTMWYSITEEEWPEVRASLQTRIAKGPLQISEA